MGRSDKFRLRRAGPSHALGVPTNGLGWRSRLRFRAFKALAITWLAVVSGQLVFLQAFKADALRERALSQHENVVEILGKRGTILDRNGNELALSTPLYSIGVLSNQVEDKPAVARRLASAVGIDEAVLLRRMERGGFQWVKRLATLGETERARALDLEFLEFDAESKRYYPHGTVAAHVLGTVGLDHYGQAGLEQQFETHLRGQPGLGVLQRDGHGRRYGTKTLQPPVPGDDIVVDLDLNIQALVHLELERAVRESKSRAGTVVLMRPRSGEIVAMSSWPRFDPNLLSRTPEDLERLRNFAISYLVEPGSTFKVLTAAAALEEGVVTKDDVFDCEMGGIWIKRRRIRDHHPYGLLTMPEVLMKSSNVGIIKIGYRVGDETLHRYLHRFGFGSRTGISLPGEVHGLVRHPSRWSGSSLASLSMGQEIGVSALQMARLFAAVANGGALVKPRIVRAIRGRDGSLIEFGQDAGARVISRDTAATMQAILERVVEAGTGRLAKIPGYRVAGKTGTAQMINPVSRSYKDGAYLASFCGFAPVNDPALVGVAMLYDPRGQWYYGGRIAAPLFASVMKQALRHLDVPPSNVMPQLARRPGTGIPEAAIADLVEGRSDDFGAVEFVAAAAGEEQEAPAGAPRARATLPGDAPDMLGLTMREAFSLANALGIEIEPTGTGIAEAQSPRPNEPLAEGQVVQVRFAPATGLEQAAVKLGGGG